jgi:hypothetical protein
MVELFKSKGLGAFWARGRLSALDQACLSSFVRRGYVIKLFSYEEIPNLPLGVTAADAAKIVPEAMIERVRYNGRADLTHFSDLFRYEMIRKADLVWVDVDVLMISGLPVPAYGDIIVREAQGGVNNAVLYVSDKTMMDTVSEAISAKLDKELRWGETGPGLISEAIKKHGTPRRIYSHKYFYPVEHYDIWKVLLPSYLSECREMCATAVTLHLFNNILTTMGYWKEMAPPKGSYLYEQLEEMELIPFFPGVYPERVMQNCVENFQFRQNGKALGIRAVLREIVPSMGRTYRHYIK